MNVFSLYVRPIIGLLAIFSLFRTFMAVRQGRLAVSRLLVPGAVALLMIGSYVSIVSRSLAITIAVLFDLALLLLAFLAVRQPANPGPTTVESRIYRALCRFFPEGFSRIVSVELAVMAAAPNALKHFFSYESPAWNSYTEAAKIKMLVLFIPLALVPDLFLTELVLRSEALWVRLLLVALSIYGCFWIWGIYASMVERRHEIYGDRLIVHRGLLGSVEFVVGEVASWNVLPDKTTIRNARRSPGKPFDLAVGGVPAVLLQLRHPVSGSSLFGLRRTATEFIVPTDRPHELVSKISMLQT